MDRLINTHKSATSEEIASHSIRANHELITDLCSAKEAVEKISDDFPDFLGVMQHDGAILRANASYCRFVGVHQEDVIDHNFTSLFSAETWRIIESALDGTKRGETCSLEVPLEVGDQEYLYHWTFSRFSAVSDRRGRLWSFLGKDITKVRETERKLATIFSAIPLGVLTINRDLQIEWPYSAYSELLLGWKDLASLHAEEGLFGKAKRFMKSDKLEGVKVLMGLLGEDEEWFEMTKPQLPVEIPFGGDEDLEPTGWRALTYNPVIKSGKIDKLLIVIEDITERVRQRNAFTARLTKEQKVAQLIFDIQDLPSDLLLSCMDDIEAYLVKCELIAKSNGKTREFCNILHGIKGVARTVNLQTFKEYVHEMEARLLRNLAEIDQQGGKRLSIEYAMMDQEWQEIKKFAKVLMTSADGEDSSLQRAKHHDGLDWEQVDARKESLTAALTGLSATIHDEKAVAALAKLQAEVSRMNYAKLSSIGKKMEQLAGVTANKLGKDIEVEFDWGDALISREQLPQITEILTHLITNAVDHGVESIEERQKAGKDELGKITVQFTSIDGNRLHGRIADDGRGIDTDIVLKKGVSKDLVKADQKLSRDEILNLLMTPGFTTKDEATDVSGRGIGLDAVSSRIRDMGGEGGLIISNSEIGKGTTIEFMIQI